MKIIDGGVTAAKGFLAAGLAAGIKKGNKKDMAMIYSSTPCMAAGTFTTNLVKAAPVKWDQEIVYHQPSAQAVVINSGVTNACTGSEGMECCQMTAQEAAKVLKTGGRFYMVHRPPASSGSSFPWIRSGKGSGTWRPCFPGRGKLPPWQPRPS